MKNLKIEIVTRSMNIKLYRLSQQLIHLPYKRRRKLFTSADGFLYDLVLHSHADIVVNIDEDAFVLDNNELEKLIEFVIKNNYINCGVPDGGVIRIRNHNPLVTNPFFNILNIKELRKKINIKDIIKNYSQHKIEFEQFLPSPIIKNHIQYEYDYYEPYNPFFVWLTTNFKTLFLDAREHSDGISTVVRSNEGVDFLLHSWYSRMYEKDKYHTHRINNLIKEANVKNTVYYDEKIQDKLLLLYQKIGDKFYFPLKYRWERKKWYS